MGSEIAVLIQNLSQSVESLLRSLVLTDKHLQYGMFTTPRCISPAIAHLFIWKVMEYFSLSVGLSEPLISEIKCWAGTSKGSLMKAWRGVVPGKSLLPPEWMFLFLCSASGLNISLTGKCSNQFSSWMTSIRSVGLTGLHPATESFEQILYLWGYLPSRASRAEKDDLHAVPMFCC